MRIAKTDDEIAGCFAVMLQLRPNLREAEFVSRIRLQERSGYRLAFLEDGRLVRAVAGYRLIENLNVGRMMYVDDLVTDDGERSKGFGGRLLSWLVERAREDGCQSLELDSGVQRFDAHRFYLAHRMIISSHHFRLKL